MDIAQNSVIALFNDFFGRQPDLIRLLPDSGSMRKYFRLSLANDTFVAAYHASKAENLAFAGYTSQFLRFGLPVPEIICRNEDDTTLILEDLGDTTLFSYLQNKRKDNIWPDALDVCYFEALDRLFAFQATGRKGFDFSLAYPVGEFNGRSINWDLNYFKYNFLKLAGIPFHESQLEDDFSRFTDYLLQAPSGFFLYRDFQSRNIMLTPKGLYFIDYQGGRKGPLQYDLASLLYDGKAAIPPVARARYLDYYLARSKEELGVDTAGFMKYFPAFVYLRIMQAMGAYGFLGLFRQKSHFLLSIPPAIENLRWLLTQYGIQDDLPELKSVLEAITGDERLSLYGQVPHQLTVRIYSFSYKSGIPADTSGHGGGFVFDCRALPNPGRYPEYASLTGNHPEIIAFLGSHPEMDAFITQTAALVTSSIETYHRRGFSSLQVSYGCTGGRHRSVYAANALARKLTETGLVTVELTHRELFDNAQVSFA